MTIPFYLPNTRQANPDGPTDIFLWTAFIVFLIWLNY